MSIGDVTQKVLLQKTLTSVNTASTISPSATNMTLTITSITVLNTSASTRTFSAYAYGSAAGNEIIRISLSTGQNVILSQLDYVLEGESSHVWYFKQDSGTDVNIVVEGIEEQIG